MEAEFITMKIQNQRNGSLTKEEIISLANALFRAGYTVTLGKETPPKGATVYYVESMGDDKN